jgi:hypothetical protein
MKVPSALRTAAVGLALSVCALLLGLSQAPHRLPGDTFQVARTARVAAAAPGGETPQGRKAPQAHDQPPAGQPWFADVTAVAVPDPALPASTAAPDGLAIHCGRLIGVAGCRGPPAS